eukprot:667687-Prymnesium_polylepis.2
MPGTHECPNIKWSLGKHAVVGREGGCTCADGLCRFKRFKPSGHGATCGVSNDNTAIAQVRAQDEEARAVAQHSVT